MGECVTEVSELSRATLVRRLQQTLTSLHAAGVEQLPKVSTSPVQTAISDHLRQRTGPLQASPQEPESSVSVSDAASLPSSNTTTSKGLFDVMDDKSNVQSSSAATLEVLSEEVAACTRCHELANTRQQTVFGVGNPRARLCFMGEAPGAEEDRQGEPFVGRAGGLLNKILDACGLSRQDVYILNVLKCRPPGNRNPAPEESQNCRPYLNRQLELISPEYICCLGAVAAQNLLETTESIGRMRGKVYEYHGIKVVCTYHPAYLLRNPSAKKHTWEDMKLLMRLMGTPVD